jgi:hypothetical protein
MMLSDLLLDLIFLMQGNSLAGVILSPAHFRCSRATSREVT